MWLEVVAGLMRILRDRIPDPDLSNPKYRAAEKAAWSAAESTPC